MKKEEREFDKVRHPEDELVMCDYGACDEHGEYIQCYFDTHKKCKKYQAYMERLVHGDDVH